MDNGLSLYLVAFGGLLLVAVLLDDLAARVRVPGILMVLLLGLLIDNHVDVVGTKQITLLNLDQAQQITEAALVLVLFFGGLTTNWQSVRGVIKPAGRLATIGVLMTAALITLVALGLGLAQGERSMAALLPKCLFVGAMVASTDASAVLALLRPLQGRLPKPLIDLIECESGFNDPMAVVLAGLALALAGGSGMEAGSLVTDLVRQFLLGILIGFFGGSLTVQLLGTRMGLNQSAMLPVVSLALLMVLSGGTSLLGGSPLLAAYVAGLVLGNSKNLDQDRLAEAHSSYAKMAELLLFLCMGLVVNPQDVVHSAALALLLFLVMQLVRLLMVHLFLWRTPFSAGERIFVCWAGLRGAVPIAMAITAWSSGVSWGASMPPIALAVVLYGLFIQGFALVPLARKLNLTLPDDAPEMSIPS
ncbi:sodium/hydrogen exchanger/ NhaP family [Synechococcus sp. A18-25c]|uniref:cation:proton antiporter domain-containing protein n=1 Tax=Synechococcus sp. A18-25c TaxID=1866938 RepID=UPI000C3D5B88|nr:cation:proton antiporter [Synechococcus sp. A18-25c]MAN18756.1 sodium:proton antiporter [Synechococcus sp. EAC657]MEC8095826.1 cation:proton antiporter [Cyanobacteriota bacterium]QNJ20943.1 sodium/hydrogen exchanger/ NhaP family [Synechococcus sp. A18-25c]